MRGEEREVDRGQAGLYDVEGRPTKIGLEGELRIVRT